MGSYFWAMAVVSVYTLAALRPLHRPPFGFVSFMLGYLLNELPFIAFAWVLAWTLSALSQGDLASTGGLAGLGLAVVTTLGLVEIVRRGSLAGEAVEHSLDRDAGPGLRSVRGSGDRPRWRRLARVLFTPLPLWSRDVQRIRNIRYGDAGRRNRLDLYRPRSRPEGGSPVFVHFHGGHFRGGGKSREARPLLYRLASRGWLCASANYRLREAGRFPRSLVDAKQAIAWLRRHGAEHGADASLLVVGGSSAGAHLASMAALTPNEPAFQPGFEDEDTSVAATVCLYGYYGPRELAGQVPSSPLAYTGPDAPPFLLAHGNNDTLLPPGSAEAFVEALRATSVSPVVYVELPGAQHSFDIFRSLRFESMVDGIEAFTARLRSERDQVGPVSHDPARWASPAPKPRR